MNTTKLSPHFAVHELFGEHEPTQQESYLATQLCVYVLEPVREVMGCPLFVTNGFRPWEQVLDLEKRGYHPSKTSDHSFGQDWYKWGVGAADLLKVVNGQRQSFSAHDYNKLVDVLLDEDSIHRKSLGQLIWYPSRGHVHVSNAREVLLTPQAQRGLNLAVKRQHFVYPEP